MVVGISIYEKIDRRKDIAIQIEDIMKNKYHDFELLNSELDTIGDDFMKKQITVHLFIKGDYEHFPKHKLHTLKSLVGMFR